MSQKTKVKFVLGSDTKKKLIMELANQALSWCIFNKEIEKNNLAKWIELKWKPLEGYML